MSSLKKFQWFTFALGFTLFGFLTLDLINFTVDDVFITLRVAENFIRGNGLVYNIGENVEGHTNLLWVLILAGPVYIKTLLALPSYSLLWMAKGLSFLCGIGSIGLIYRLYRRSGVQSSRYYATLCALALLCCGPLILWSVAGLETTFCALLITLLYYQTCRVLNNNTRTSIFTTIGLLGGLLFATHPDQLLHGCISLIFLYFSVERPHRKKVLYAAVLLGICVLSVFLFRWYFYHDLAPNTFYAKGGGGFKTRILGTKYLFAGIGAITGLLLVLCPFIFQKSLRQQKTIQLGILLVLTSIFITLYVGGDWMAGFRFLIPITPVLYYLLINALQDISSRVITRPIHDWSFLTTALVLTFLSVSSAMASRTLVRDQTLNLESGFTTRTGHPLPDHERVSLWLNHRFPDHVTVGTGEAGLIGFLNPQLRLLDFNGLMDKEVAMRRYHRLPFDANYFLSKSPDLLLFTGAITKRYSSDEYLNSFNKLELFKANYDLDTVIGDFQIFSRKTLLNLD